MDKALACHTGGRGSNRDMTKGNNYPGVQHLSPVRIAKLYYLISLFDMISLYGRVRIPVAF